MARTESAGSAGTWFSAGGESVCPGNRAARFRRLSGGVEPANGGGAVTAADGTDKAESFAHSGIQRRSRQNGRAGIPGRLYDEPPSYLLHYYWRTDRYRQ